MVAHRAASSNVGTLFAMQKRAVLLQRLASYAQQRGRADLRLEKLLEFCNLVENRVLAHSAFPSVVREAEFEALMAQFLEAKQELVRAGWETKHVETPSPSKSPPTSRPGTGKVTGVVQAGKSESATRPGRRLSTSQTRDSITPREVLLSRLGERATADTSASTPRYSSPRETKSFVKEGKEEELSLRENARQRFLQVSAQKERAARHRRSLLAQRQHSAASSFSMPGSHYSESWASEAEPASSRTTLTAASRRDLDVMDVDSDAYVTPNQHHTPAAGRSSVTGSLHQRASLQETLDVTQDVDCAPLPEGSSLSLLTFLSDIASGLSHMKEVHACVLDIQAKLGGASITFSPSPPRTREKAAEGSPVAESPGGVSSATHSETARGDTLDQGPSFWYMTENVQSMNSSGDGCSGSVIRGSHGATCEAETASAQSALAPVDNSPQLVQDKQSRNHLAQTPDSEATVSLYSPISQKQMSQTSYGMDISPVSDAFSPTQSRPNPDGAESIQTPATLTSHKATIPSSSYGCDSRDPSPTHPPSQQQVADSPGPPLSPHVVSRGKASVPSSPSCDCDSREASPLPPSPEATDSPDTPLSSQLILRGRRKPSNPLSSPVNSQKLATPESTAPAAGRDSAEFWSTWRSPCAHQGPLALGGVDATMGPSPGTRQSVALDEMHTSGEFVRASTMYDAVVSQNELVSERQSARPEERMSLGSQQGPSQGESKGELASTPVTQEVHVVCNGARSRKSGGVIRQGVKARELFSLEKEIQELSLGSDKRERGQVHLEGGFRRWQAPALARHPQRS